jgi:mono/diheme cytochrome c family protein
MRSFISFQPGERRGCVGCHETRAESAAAEQAPAALRMEARIPVPPSWGSRAISFLRDVQPVLDRHCVRCHGGLSPKGGLDFSPGLTVQHNRAYDTILAHNLVAWSNVNEDAKITAPLAFGSHKSKLIKVLQSEEHDKRVQLSRDEWLRLVTWIDANAPYHDRFINKRPAHEPYDLAADVGLVEAIKAVHGRRCGSCHEASAVTRTDWIDPARPERSLFLTAPLAAEPDGRRLCEKPTYANRDDPDYRKVLEIVESAVARALKYPRRDLEFLSLRR